MLQGRAQLGLRAGSQLTSAFPIPAPLLRQGTCRGRGCSPSEGELVWTRVQMPSWGPAYRIPSVASHGPWRRPRLARSLGVEFKESVRPHCVSESSQRHFLKNIWCRRRRTPSSFPRAVKGGCTHDSQLSGSGTLRPGPRPVAGLPVSRRRHSRRADGLSPYQSPAGIAVGWAVCSGPGGGLRRIDWYPGL